MDEKEQNLYCMAQHLQTFVEDAKYERVSDFGKPCVTCKYVRECESNFFSNSKTLTELTGIRFNPSMKRRIKE